MDDVRLTVHTMPVDQRLYDDLARDFGYRDVADLIAQAEAKRATLPPELLPLIDELERRVDAKMLGLD